MISATNLRSHAPVLRHLQRAPLHTNASATVGAPLLLAQAAASTLQPFPWKASMLRLQTAPDPPGCRSRACPPRPPSCHREEAGRRGRQAVLSMHDVVRARSGGGGGCQCGTSMLCTAGQLALAAPAAKPRSYELPCPHWIRLMTFFLIVCDRASSCYDVWPRCEADSHAVVPATCRLRSRHLNCTM